MNLTNLFEIQRKLDAEIEAKHPTTAGEDRLAKRILALQVELGECANEWRGFKFWSMRQTANTLYQTTCDPDIATHHYCEDCKEDVANKDTLKHFKKCEGILYPMRAKNPLLEEYVDCLHFALSIGLNLKVKTSAIAINLSPVWMPDITDHFLWTNHKLVQLYQDIRDMKGEASKYCFLQLMNALVGLGEMLGFTWNQIEQAYLSKNKTNWERQANGY